MHWALATLDTVPIDKILSVKNCAEMGLNGFIFKKINEKEKEKEKRKKNPRSRLGFAC